MFSGARVENLAPPDFSKDAEMYQSLSIAVEAIAKKVALRRLERGE